MTWMGLLMGSGLLLSPAGARGEAAGATATATVDAEALPGISAADAVREALAASPGLVAAREDAAAAGRATWSAYSPGEVMVEGAREHDAGMNSSTLTLRAVVPFPGTSVFLGRAATESARAARARVRAAELETTARARSAHSRLWRADVDLEALGAARDLMRQTAVIAQARVAGGRGGTEDLLLAQAEAARMGVNVEMVRSRRTGVEAELAALLHRPAGRDRFGPADAPPLEEVALDREALLARARAAGPGAAAAEHEARAAGAFATAATINVLPRLAPFYARTRHDGGGSGTMAGLGVTYPLFVWAPAAEAGAARAAKRAARARAEEAGDAAVRMAAEEIAEVEAHAFAAREYREVVLPLLAQAVRAARASYESGRGDMLKLLTAARDEVTARREYAAERAQFTEHRARLEQAVGGPLEETR